MKRSAGTLGLYVVVNFAMAATWHMVLFKDLLADATPFLRPEPLFPLGIAAMITQAVLLIGLYPRFQRPRRAASTGLLFGAAAGLFLASGSIWVDVAKFSFAAPVTYLLVETVYTIGSFAVLGLVIALRYRAPEA